MQWPSKSSAETLNPEIRNERVAVLPLKNKTNDVDLDIMGDMAADWINRGLIEVQDAEVVSPYTVRQHLNSVGILPNQSNEDSFYELTGARHYIDSNFYKEGDDLIFNLSMADAIDGKVVFNFPVIRGSNDGREALIDLLREKIMGYWAAKDLVNMKKIKTPNYQAYQLYLEFLNKTFDQAKLYKILEIDSLFYLPRIQYLNMNRAGIYGGENVIHFEFLARHLDELSQYETSWLHYLRNMYLGNLENTFEAINSLRLKYSKDFRVNHETAVVAHEGFNNPELAEEIYADLSLSTNHRKSGGDLYNFRLMHTITMAIRRGGKEHIQNIIDSAVPNNSIQSLIVMPKALGAAIVNDQNSFNSFLTQLITVDNEEAYSKLYWLSHTQTSNLLDTDEREQFRTLVLTILNRSDQQDILRNLSKNYLEYMESGKTSLDFDQLSELPDMLQVFNLYWASIALIESDEEDDLKEIVEKLKSFTTPNLDHSAWFVSGVAAYTLGLIHLHKKDENRAIEYLKKSRDFGMPSFVNFFKYDRYLESLYDNAEFQELNKPKWPQMAD